jgi:Xaa-Pro aminopeptidase
LLLEGLMKFHRVCGALLALALCAAALAGRGYAADAGTWKVAPPPPESWQHDRVTDLTARRKAVMDRIGQHAILILYAAEARNYAGDVDWPFRQENDFFYLTGLKQTGATLVLVPGAASMKEVLFLPPSNPRQEIWTGHLITPPEAREISGIQQVWGTAQLDDLLTTLIPRARGVLSPGSHGAGRGWHSTTPPAHPEWSAEFKVPIASITNGEAQLYMVLPERPESAEHRREQEFAAKLASIGPGVSIKDVTSIFDELRRVKSQREIDILKHALDITAEAFQRAYAVAVPGTWEYEIQAQFEFTFLRRNGHWGYPCIVGSGVNATTLHYETNQDQMKDGDLLLMDDAAEFDGYSVDVTRTIPVNGRYTREQADIYRLVWEAQKAGIAMARPGHAPSGTKDSIQGAANEVFKQGLYKLGLITDPVSDQQLRVWFTHGISHGIGLNVHDPGGRELQPGMVVTVEPGLYFRPDALDNLPKTPENEKFIEAVRPVFEKYKGIGVRIEDDVLVTTGEPQVLSAAIPSRLEDVEASIAELRKTIKTTPLP